MSAARSGEGDANWKYEWASRGGYRARWLRDGETFAVGGVELRAAHTPGHTPEHLSFLVTDSGGGATEPMGMVTGDFVFVGDLGRPDLLESAAGVEGVARPSARRLYDSANRLLEFADYLQLWPGHGAGSACGKALGAVPQSTLGAFFAGHLTGSIFAPLDRTFPTIAGSYADPDLPVYLVVQPEKLDEAVRDLIHVGLDRVVGFATPETLSGAGDLAATRSIDFRGLERRRGEPAAGVLDVRSAAEHASGHVPGAVNLPQTRLPARLSEVPAGGEVLVHCGSGARAASAVSLLEREGFRAIHVDGAFAGWAARADG